MPTSLVLLRHTSHLQCTAHSFRSIWCAFLLLFPLLFFAFAVLSSTPACAQAGFHQVYPGSRPLTPKDLPDDRQPIKLSKVNQADLFTGTYRYEIDIPVPPGRGGLTPSVRLKYQSGGDRTQLGLGWDIEHDYIRRSLRKGVPRYTSLTNGDNPQDELEFKIGDEQGILVFDRPVSGGYLYRPKREGSFLKFFYHPYDAANWTVYAPSGVVWHLGSTDPDSRHHDGHGHVFAWNIRTIEDPDGNRVTYDWFPGTPFLRLIYYNSSNVTDGDLSVGAHVNVEFTWDAFTSDDNTHTIIDYTKGFQERFGSWALTNIQVTGFGERGTSLSRNFHIESGRVRVASGTREIGPPSIVSVEPEALPHTRFAYTRPPDSGFPTRRDILDLYPTSANVDQQTLAGTRVNYAPNGIFGCPHNPSGECFTTLTRLVNMLVDVDGDGDKDILSAHGNTVWKWRENKGGSFFSSYEVLGVPREIPFPDALSYEESVQDGVHQENDVYQRILDMNGDGQADIVYQDTSGSRTNVYVCLGSVLDPEGSRRFWPCTEWFSHNAAPSLISHSESIRNGAWTFSWQTNDLFDINGDGLPDLVDVDYHEDSDWAVFHNNGQAFASTPSINIQAPLCEDVSLSYFGLSDAPECIRSNISLDDGRSGVTCGIRDLTDMNGDGILDRTRRPYWNIGFSWRYPDGRGVGEIGPYYCGTADDALSSIEWSYGTGTSFLGGEGYKFAHNIPMQTTYHTPQVRSPPQLFIGATDGQFIDVNGDRMPDLVYWQNSSPQSLMVAINTGEGFLAPYPWDLPESAFPPGPGLPVPSFYPGVSATVNIPPALAGSGDDQDFDIGGYGLVQTLDDINGDGRVELIWVPRYNPIISITNTPFVVVGTDPAYAAPTEFVIGVHEGNTHRTEIEYHIPNDEFNLVPHPQWAVTRLSTIDRVTQQELRKDYSYDGGAWDAETAEFRGYGFVWETDDYKGIVHEFLQGEFNSGLKISTGVYEVKDGQYTLKQDDGTVFHDEVFDNGSRIWVRPTLTYTTNYDGGSLYQKITEYEYGYPATDHSLQYLTGVISYLKFPSLITLRAA